MRVLIIGSSGFVGRSLRAYLSGKGHEVIGMDVRGDVEHNVDVLRLDQLYEVMYRIKPDAVVHLAAVSNPPSCLLDVYNCFRVNVMGTLNALEASSKTGVSRFVYISSANVYGVPKDLPVSEEHPLNPRTPYDHSKVAAENIVMSYCKRGLPCVIMRPWKLFGEYDTDESAISRFVDSCLTNRPITLYNGGKDVTDPCYVENFCYMLELALRNEKAVGEVFNVGTGNRISIEELAVRIKRLTNSDSPMTYLPPRSELEKEPMISYPSIEKARRLLGYEPIVPLDEGLIRVIRYRATRLLRSTQ